MSENSEIMHRKYGTYVCRLCLERNRDLMDIFEGNERNGLVVAQVISELFHAIVSRDDDYPNVICQNCHSKLMGFYRMKRKFPIDSYPGFVLFKNQSQIVSSAIDYAKKYNVATPDYQHSPISWDHSPLSLELEQLAAEDELQTRRLVVDELLDSVAHILKNIQNEARHLEETAENEACPLSMESSFDGESKACYPAEVTLVTSDDNGAPSDIGNVTSPPSPPTENHQRLVLRGCESKHQASKDIQPVGTSKGWIQEEKFSAKTMGQLCNQKPPSERRSGRSKAREVSSWGKSQQRVRALSSAEPESTADHHKCAICCKQYMRRADLQKHVRRIHLIYDFLKEESPESSDSLQVDTSTDISLSGRMDMAAGPSTQDYGYYRCDLCSNKYNRISDLNMHLEKLHLKKVGNGSSPTNSAKSRKRKEPKAKRSKNSDIWNKMALDVDGEEGCIRCFACGARFTCLEDLKEHIMLPKSLVEKKGTRKKEGKVYTCCCCKQNFGWLVMLERHVKTQHSDERPYTCQECGISFKLEKYLKKHAKLHTGTKTIKCEDCGKMFQDRSLLRLHLSVHTIEETFECVVCGKKFRAKHLLQIHLRIHNKSSHIKCPECPRKFTQRSDLKKHMVQHSGVRNFSCPECNKKFLYKRNLNSHIHLHKRLKVALYER